MSIFKTIGSGLGKVGRFLLGNADEIAGVIALAGPGKFKTVARLVLLGLPVVRKIFAKGESDMGNPFTELVDALIKAIAGAKEKSGIELLLAIVPALTEVAGVAQYISSNDKAVWMPVLKEALDAKIGSEPGALIGDQPNAVIKIDLPWLPVEMVSDLILNAVESSLLKKTA